MWIVAVSDQSATCLYGPFRTQTEAQKWADDNANAFFGRNVHVMRQQLIDPFEER